MLKNFNTTITTTLFFLAAVIFKITPHLPNFSPELVFAVFVGCRYNKLTQALLILALLVSCDVLYCATSPFQAFGSWTLFTYSGLLALGLAANSLKLKPGQWRFTGICLLSSLLFWTWTNFGTWLASPLYPHTLQGITLCFSLALPFLGFSLASAATWSVAIKLIQGHKTLFAKHKPLKNNLM